MMATSGVVDVAATNLGGGIVDPKGPPPVHMKPRVEAMTSLLDPLKEKWEPASVVGAMVVSSSVKHDVAVADDGRSRHGGAIILHLQEDNQEAFVDAGGRTTRCH